jgi:hypothetical protein
MLCDSTYLTRLQLVTPLMIFTVEFVTPVVVSWLVFLALHPDCCVGGDLLEQC